MLSGTVPRSRLVAAIGDELGGLEQRIAKADAVERIGYVSMLHALGYLAARIGEPTLLERAKAGAAAIDGVGDHPLLVQMQRVLEAESERLAGRPQAAVERLAPLAARPDAIVPLHSALLRSLQADGQSAAALEQARWLAAHRGRAYIERSADDLLLAVNVADTTTAHVDAAEALRQLGKPQGVAAESGAFRAAWPRERWPVRLGDRVAALR